MTTPPNNAAMKQAIATMDLTITPELNAEIVATRNGDTTPAASAPVEQAFGAWGQITAMAQSLARSNLVKPALRGRPDDIALTLLVGRDLGLAPTMALAKIHVIEGQPSLSAEAMAALIVGHGHSMTGDIERDTHGHPTAAVITGTRGDNGQTMTVDYTIGEAVAAGLCTIDPTTSNGVRARSRNGAPQAWEKHTSDMLWARCVSRIGRRLFADVLVGVSYVPEELGAVIDVEAVDDEQPFRDHGWESRAASVEAHTALRPSIVDLPDVLRDGIRTEHGWPIYDRAAFDLIAATVTTLQHGPDVVDDEHGRQAFGAAAWNAYCSTTGTDTVGVGVAPHIPDATADTNDPTVTCQKCGQIGGCQCPF